MKAEIFLLRATGLEAFTLQLFVHGSNLRLVMHKLARLREGMGVARKQREMKSGTQSMEWY